AEWQAAARARTAADFDRQWDRALRALSVETEKAFRGAFGLSTQVPPWLEEPGEGTQTPSHKPAGSPRPRRCDVLRITRRHGFE
ncbi:hypothetical protein SF23_11480, partial [Streptomyces sp. MBRL 10]